MNPTQQLHEAGQSLWLDSINRKMLQDGTLSGYIDHLALTGLTSNPTILGHAMAAGSDYDDSQRTHSQQEHQSPRSWSSRSRWRTSRRRRICSVRYGTAPTVSMGTSRSRYRRVWPTTPTAASRSPASCTSKRAARTCW